MKSEVQILSPRWFLPRAAAAPSRGRSTEAGLANSRRRYLVAVGLAYALSVLLTTECLAAPARISGAPLVYVRSGPGADHEPIGVLAAGDVVETYEDIGSWTKIAVGGKTGYVHRSFLVASPGIAPAAAPPPSPGIAPAPASPAMAEALPPTPAAAVPEGTPMIGELSEEVAGLRAEVADLKRRVQTTPPSGTKLLERKPAELPAAPAPFGAPADPAPAGAPADPNVRVATAAVVSLVVGWLLGASFSRRRNRTQRGRLRF